MVTIRANTGKRGRPATGRGHTVGVRIHPDLMAVLDQWRSAQTPIPTRPEALRAIVQDWMIGHGLLPLEPEDELEGSPEG